MKSLFTKGLAILSFAVLSFGNLMAQGTTTPATPAAPPAPKPVDHSYKPLKLNLSEDGKKFVRIILWHQMWFTATQNNPGTTDVNGKLIDGTDGTKAWSTDIAIRRSRMLLHAQVSPRFMILTHFGINNQSFINGGAGAGSNVSSSGTANAGKRAQLYIHDAWTEYAVDSKNRLSVGMGLHYWNGISRLTSNSTLNFMTLDAPIFNWANIEVTDQFARQFGIYAKGQLGKFDYRLSWNKPFVSGTTPGAVAKNGVAVNVTNESPAVGGYFKYMLWDKESNVYPFEVGTYLGSKKVLNIGAGFYSQKNATLLKNKVYADPGRDSIFNNQTCLGADLYLDMPLNKQKGTAVNALLTYYNYDFGANYLRNVGILNEHAAVTSVATAANTKSWAGGGNLQPTIGTGQIIYAQAGFKTPNMKNGQSFMPYATFTYKNFERIGSSSTQFGVGVNYFVAGHNAKWTLEYQTRPVYNTATDGSIARNGSKGQLIIQSHIFL